MRAFLASTIGVACAAALSLPLALPAGAAPPSASRQPAGTVAGAGQPAGGTQSLPLTAPAGADRSAGAAARVLPPRTVRPYSMLGIVWDDAGEELHGRAQVRTRSTASGQWSGWRDLSAHHDDAPDPVPGERRRGGTAPLWVGASDGVQVRVVPERTADRAPAAFPAGLRIELVDPGGDPGTGNAGNAADTADPADNEDDAPGSGPRDRAGGLTAAERQSAAANAELAPIGATEIAPLGRTATEEAAQRSAEPRAASRYIGPRPGIVIRRGWGANESWRERRFPYTKTVRTAFVHHSGTGNGYSCAQAPSVLRGIYRYHVHSMKWRDIGYNFAVDKCGTIYEGRAGGVARAVQGAHTLGFNHNSMGIAVLGTYDAARPSRQAVEAVAKLTAWKLGLFGRNPAGSGTRVSLGNTKYPKGTRVTLRVISGHRDGFYTDCPGARLYDRLGGIRGLAARLQGR
ncbi:N-acetylmuramoyl-L-alanine amidase [Streptomyces sp. S07_1.15]|uniref:N-acetylmuramoyl-L-alanine amidase n=1 Tax=Streptomyces sp. S07_1.15 TaxID=2873925 RepID=UPI001D157CA5|nr:N-acetylmuramoyl-L-alanine amidase [Streptomyces sp. S07_1.15]MCC3653575.1 N-acetylmuramoyl-L-alanine amidase [Streptomyces sp. S07_1.15]